MFAVSMDEPDRNSERKFKYPTANAAEVAARRYVAGRGGEMSIWAKRTRDSQGYSLDKSIPAPVSQLFVGGEEVATVLRDALGRVWTQVTHSGGRFL